MNGPQKILPFFLFGKVVKGFGRGSKTLGCPTANLDESAVNSLPSELKAGIYYGWAKVDGSPVYKQVTSIGWNPYFNNTVKSIETHILNEFPEDFYGSDIKICLTGYIREEMNFKSLEELKDEIASDIAKAHQELSKTEQIAYSQSPFFLGKSNKEVTNGFH